MRIPWSVRLLACMAPLVALCLAPGGVARAADTANQTQQRKGSGLPIPRFASLRSDEVNLRAGPGTRYPIQWVYKRRDLPVEIERDFEATRHLVEAERGHEPQCPPADAEPEHAPLQPAKVESEFAVAVSVTEVPDV